MIELSIKLYQLHELTEKARQKAISEHRGFILSTMAPEDFISGDPEHDTPEKLQEAQELEQDYYLFNDEPIIESLEINEYLFYADGALCHCCHYTGGPKKGTVEIIIHGETYTLQEVTAV